MSESATGTSLNRSSGFPYGIEVLLSGNFYLGKRGGLSLVNSTELLPITWNTPMVEVYGANRDDFLWSVSLAFGGFYDAVKAKHIALRLFANLGVVVNFLFNGSYSGEVTTYYYAALTNRTPITMPITFGMRLILAGHNGLEIAFKYNPFPMNYYVTASESTIATTSISRGFSTGVRYVHEF